VASHRPYREVPSAIKETWSKSSDGLSHGLDVWGFGSLTAPSRKRSDPTIHRALTRHNFLDTADVYGPRRVRNWWALPCAGVATGLFWQRIGNMRVRGRCYRIMADPSMCARRASPACAAGRLKFSISNYQTALTAPAHRRTVGHVAPGGRGQGRYLGAF